MLMKKEINQEKILMFIFSIIPIAVITYCFGSGISGNDFWWHIKVGEYIAESLSVPTSDIFSWIGSISKIEWTAHEWLAEVIYYLIFKSFGEIGIFLFSIGCAFALYFCLWTVSKKYAKNNILFSGLFFSLFAVLTSMFFYGRPHVFSYFFVFFELKILFDVFDEKCDNKLFFIPIISFFWSNVHGGSSNLSYILCIVFLLCGLCNFDFNRIESKKLSSKIIIKLLMVTILSIITILINPAGIKVFFYPYLSINDKLSMMLISEWRSPDAKLIGNLILYFLPIVVTSIGIVSKKTRVRLIDLAVMLVFLFLFFRSARFIILWYISACFYSFRYLPCIKVKQITNFYDRIAVCILAVLILLPTVVGIYSTVETYKNGKLISKAISDEAIDAVRKDSPKRIFNDYNLGGALIYNDIPVFFDERADLYSKNNIMADGVSLLYLEQANKESKKSYVDVNELIDKYEFDAVLILKCRALYSYIISHPELFELIYDDKDLAYFRIKQ